MTDDASGPHGEYLHDRGEATRLSHEGAWAAAAASWHRVTTANPDNGNHWESLARACYEAGDYERALVAYRKVDELGVTAAREDIAAPGAVRYRIACCHARLGDPSAALGEAVDSGYRDLDAARSPRWQ
jgi:tetratricopeptide (TPR) repeat protein